MFKLLILSYLIACTSSIPTFKCQQRPTPDTPYTPDTPDTPDTPSSGENLSNYWNGSCNTNGAYSVNEFGANICEYPGNTCPIVKYFSYPDGGNGVELCCNTNSDCNYDPVKNYCNPDLQRCVDGSYFGCSEKAGPIFDSCL